MGFVRGGSLSGFALVVVGTAAAAAAAGRGRATSFQKSRGIMNEWMDSLERWSALSFLG